MPVYTPRFKPWSHQIEAHNRLDGQKAFALLMGMRTGKTKVSLDDFGRLEFENKADDLLVLAPAGVYNTWETAKNDHLSDDLSERLRFHKWVSSGGRQQKRDLEFHLDLMNGQPRMLLMNIEAYCRVTEAREAANKFLRQRPGRNVALIDESTVIKNPQSNQTKLVTDGVGNLAEYRRILSGLPSPKNPLDLYSQFYFLDWRILGENSFYTYRARYADLIRFKNSQDKNVIKITGWNNLERIYNKIAPYSYRVRLEDCYDVPPKEYVIREVAMTPEQARIYKEMKEFATAKLSEDDHVTATVVIAQLIRLHQILCGHVTTELGEEFEISENRTSELMALLEEYDGKAVIWCSYDADIKRIQSALERVYGTNSVSRFWGGNRATRESEEKEFLSNPDRRFMLATASAGGRGRLWSIANLVIYYSNTDNLDHRMQSEERTQMMDKADHVTYVDLMTPNTVDVKIVRSMRNKLYLSAAVMGEEPKRWLEP